MVEKIEKKPKTPRKKYPRNPSTRFRYFQIRLTIEEETAVKTHIAQIGVAKSSFVRKAVLNQIRLERRGNPLARIEHKIDSILAQLHNRDRGS